MLMASPAPVVTCTEPGCTALVFAGGMCRRCWNAAYYRANRARLLQAKADQAPPAVTRAISVVVACIRCGHRFSVPGVGVVPCPQCHRRLRPVLDVSNRPCPCCQGPVPAGARYCSSRCRSAAKEARRPPRDRRRAAQAS